MPKRRKFDDHEKRSAGALTNNQYWSVCSTINRLKGRVLETHSCDLTVSDLVNCFVPSHLRYMAVEYGPLFSGDHVDNKFKTSFFVKPKGELHYLVNLSVEHSGPSFAFPVNGLCLQSGISPSQNRLFKWLAWRVEIEKQWKLVHGVLNILVERCETLAQVRYYMPAITVLLNNCDVPLADKLRRQKVPDDIPHVPKEWRSACRTATAIVAAATFIPADVKTTGAVKLWATFERKHGLIPPVTHLPEVPSIVAPGLNIKLADDELEAG